MSFASLRRVGVTTALSAAFLAVSPIARADAESDAKDLFARAYAMRKGGDCISAVPLLHKAYAIYPKGLGSLRNIAECEEQLGHYASARRAWLDIKRAVIVMPAADPKYEGWDKDADDAAARLLPKVATVTVDVTVKTPQSEGPANERSGVELVINGERLGTTLVGTPLERDPGTYTIRVQAPDAQPVEQSITLGAGENNHVALRVVRWPKETGPDGVEPPRDQHGSGQRTLGWIVTGVGAAALVGSGITFLLYGSAKNDVRDSCGQGGFANCAVRPSDQASVESTRSRGVTMGTLSPILLAAGIAGVGAGLALVFTAGPSKSASVTITPRVAGADATLRW